MGEAFLMGQNGKSEQSKTVTPNTAGFTVSPDAGKTLSSVVINGDANLIADNVKEGVNVFGVVGSLTSFPVSRTLKCNRSGYPTTYVALLATSAGGTKVSSMTIGMTGKYGMFSSSTWSDYWFEVDTTYNY